jgi:hypothetical protein
MIAAPMLADFATRLALGLAVALLLTSSRVVPLSFFRTQAQVILGLLVLAGLDQARAGGQPWEVWVLVIGAVAAYSSSVAWGLGLPRFGAASTALVFFVTACWLLMSLPSRGSAVWAFNTASRLSSGLLLGTTLTAMLLGHHYLTAPAMPIDPLKRIIGFLALSLLVRCGLAGFILCAGRARSMGWTATDGYSDAGTLLAARWGMGFLGTAIATYMTWRTAQIRSTQSATGILYITMIFVLFGELTAMILAGRSGALG